MTTAVQYDDGIKKIIHVTQTKEEAKRYVEEYVYDYIVSKDGTSSNIFVDKLLYDYKLLNRHQCIKSHNIISVYKIIESNSYFSNFDSELIFEIEFIPVECEVYTLEILDESVMNLPKIMRQSVDENLFSNSY